MGRSGGRPAANAEHLPVPAGTHFVNGDQRLDSQHRFHNTLVSADALPDIVRFFHGVVRQK